MNSLLVFFERDDEVVKTVRMTGRRRLLPLFPEEVEAIAQMCGVDFKTVTWRVELDEVA